MSVVESLVEWAILTVSNIVSAIFGGKYVSKIMAS